MIFKIVTLFLVVIALLAMFGRFRVGGWPRKTSSSTAKKCPKCGAYILGNGPCACGYRKG